MSNNLINGFEDLVNRSVLSSNSNFRINQRGNFSSLTSVVINDIVSDMWKVSGLNIDYIEAQNDTSNNWIKFSGYGKKGQTITLNNIDTSDLGYGTNAITSSVKVQNISGVPISISTSPRKGSSSTVLFSSSPVIKSGITKSSIQALTTATQSITTASTITITLNASGDFSIYILGFQEIAGAYRNPPSFAPVPYADDLARAERYFQVGEASGASYVPFRTKMSGTPTITLSSGSPSSITTNGFVTSGTGVHTWTASV